MQGINRGAYHGFNLVVADLVTGEMAYGANPLPREDRLLGEGSVIGDSGNPPPLPSVDPSASTAAPTNEDIITLAQAGPVKLDAGKLYGEWQYGVMHLMSPCHDRSCDHVVTYLIVSMWEVVGPRALLYGRWPSLFLSGPGHC